MEGGSLLSAEEPQKVTGKSSCNDVKGVRVKTEWSVHRTAGLQRRAAHRMSLRAGSNGGELAPWCSRPRKSQSSYTI